MCRTISNFFFGCFSAQASFSSRTISFSSLARCSSMANLLDHGIARLHLDIADLNNHVFPNGVHGQHFYDQRQFRRVTSRRLQRLSVIYSLLVLSIVFQEKRHHTVSVHGFRHRIGKRRRQLLEILISPVRIYIFSLSIVKLHLNFH